MPKKNAAKTIQKPIITIELGLGDSKSKAPGRKRMTNMPTTSTGDANRMASDSGLRTNVSALRRVRTLHCVSAVATGRRSTSADRSASVDSTGVLHEYLGISDSVNR